MNTLFFIETAMRNDWGQRYGTLRHAIVDENNEPVKTLDEAKMHIENTEYEIVDVSEDFENTWGNRNDLWAQEDFGPNFHMGNFVDDDFNIVDKYGNLRNDHAKAA